MGVKDRDVNVFTCEATFSTFTNVELDPDRRSLRETLIYGLKGVAAYAGHAQILGQEDEEVYSFMLKALASSLNKDMGLEDWVGLVLECGKANLKAMAVLDAANTGTYGHYGAAWQNQIKEFPKFPGSIIMTTNCIQKPKESYFDRIFTRKGP